MIHLAYCSAAAELMSSADLAALLRTSRQNNAERGITGMLLYHEGSFMQVLEGDEHAVIDTYRKILLDPRHHNLIKMLEGPIPQRSFETWSMGFAGPAELSNADRAAFSHFLDEPIENESVAIAGGRALKLLQGFRGLTQ